MKGRTGLNKNVLTWMGLGGLILTCSGCPQYRDASVPNEITREVAADTSTPYLLYVPSTYDREHNWPLVILCHGTKPWDTPLRQMKDWVKYAEERGFLVAGPELRGTVGWPPPSADAQVAVQLEDEDRILETVRDIRGAYRISEQRMFLSGWSAGSFAVLHTGLRHPEVFRALAIQQGNFEANYLADVAPRLDPHQPIAVIHGTADVITGHDARDCVSWLSDHNANLYELEVAGGHRAHPTVVMGFFERVLRNEPWLHIRTLAVEGGHPLEVQFKSRGSFEPRSYRWQFGDGQSSPVSEPIHRYDAAGEYRVTLEATTPKRKSVRRTILLKVPQAQALSAERTEWEPEPSS